MPDFGHALSQKALIDLLAQNAVSTIIGHIDTFHPQMWEGARSTARRSLRGAIYIAVTETLKAHAEQQAERGQG